MPREPSLVSIESGQFFPHLAIEKPVGIDVVSVPELLHGMLIVVQMACGAIHMSDSQKSKLEKEFFI